MNCPARSPSAYSVPGPEALPPIPDRLCDLGSVSALSGPRFCPGPEPRSGLRERRGSPSLETGTADPGMTEGGGLLHGSHFFTAVGETEAQRAVET